MGIEALKGNQFLTLSKPYAVNGNGSDVVAYHQGRSETPSYENKGLFENINELEARQSNGSNFFVTKPQSIAVNNRGSLWGDFKVPENNGTGELIPEVDDENHRTIAMG